MLRVSTKPRRKNAPRIAEKSAPGFLRFVRTRDKCLFEQIDNCCEGPIEPMHLDFAGGKGVGSKVADKYTVPSCAKHHRRQHTIGWITFLAEMELSKELMLEAAAHYWRRWPSRLAWERKLSDG